jgi:hypothetical protein
MIHPLNSAKFYKIMSLRASPCLYTSFSQIKHKSSTVKLKANSPVIWFIKTLEINKIILSVWTLKKDRLEGSHILKKCKKRETLKRLLKRNRHKFALIWPKVQISLKQTLLFLLREHYNMKKLSSSSNNLQKLFSSLSESTRIGVITVED